jgi:hypothetical protein
MTASPLKAGSVVGVRFLDLRCLRRTAKDAHASGLDRAATGDPYTCPTLNALAHERVRVRHRKVVDARTWEHVGRFELGRELRHTELVLLKAGALLGSQPPTPKHSRCRWSLRLRLFREEVEFLLDRCGTVTTHHRHQARCPLRVISGEAGAPIAIKMLPP